MSRLRTLIRVDRLVDGDKAISVYLISWTPEDENHVVKIPIRKLPVPFAVRAMSDLFPFWVTCQANLGASTADQLEMSDFEFAYE